MRTILAMAAAGLLAGCNIVITSAPLFSKADEAGAPLKPGLWANPNDASCVFDRQAPLASWPDCAHGVVISGGTIGEYKDDNGKPALSKTEYVLVGGQPMIIQIHEAQDAAGSGLTLSGYFYGGLRPSKTDEQGRITAYSAWPVLCGPPPPDNTAIANGKMVYGTRQPLPGMVMDKDGNNCTTASADAVRNAAGPSEKWTSGGSAPSYWVRDGDR